VRAALGDDTYLAAYEAGLSLTPEQAVAALTLVDYDEAHLHRER